MEFLAVRRRAVLAALFTTLLFISACTAAAPATQAPDSPSPSPVATEAPTDTSTTAPSASPASTPTSAATSPPDDGGYGGYEPPPATATATAAAAETTVSISDSPEHGEYLAGPNGFALYLFAQDEPGVSNCTGGCADAWPPLTVEMGETPTGGQGVSGTFDLTERSRGALQVTYNGAPLYYYAGDEEPIDTNGEGVGGVWSLARP